MQEIPFKAPPLYSSDYNSDFPPIARAFKEAIAAIDADLFVTPKYNRSVASGMKNAIDWRADPPTSIPSLASGHERESRCGTVAG